MKKQFTAAIATVLLLVSYSAAQNVSPSELQFREALHKQQVEGDLTNAIKIYQNIIASKTADRSVKAKALLQLAACYEKLGQKSEAVYQQIVRDYSDQPAAPQARAKLAALKPPAPASTMTMRKIEMGVDVRNIVDTDGQRAVYWDSTETTLYIGDLAGKDKRVVYKTNRKARASVSRDLSLVFLFFQESEQGPAGYGIVKTDGTGYRDFTLTENGQKVPASAPFSVSWSWDNRFLLICKLQADRISHLLKVNVADGSAQDMLSEQKRSVFSAQFSPDGRFIAYGEAVMLGAVRIIRSDGGTPKLIAMDAGITDWTRDGRYLMLYKAPSNLKVQMWAAPIRNGEEGGEPILVRSSIPSGSYWKTAPNGAMILEVSNAQTILPTLQIHSSSLDSQNRLEEWKRLELVDPAFGPGPIWSPDGRQIAYVGKGGENSRGAVRVYTMSSGEDREVYRSKTGLWTCVWALKHPTLYCGQIATGQKTEIMAVTLDSGRAEKVGELDGPRLLFRINSDDRVLTTANVGGGGFEWEIGTDREVPISNAITTSQDGRWVYELSSDHENRRQLRVRPATGDNEDWRRLAYVRRQRVAGALNFIPIRFTPDGNWIVYHDKDSDGKDGLYRVSVSGGEPERLGDYAVTINGTEISVSPDGRHFIVSTGAERPQEGEFWMLENFIPATTKAVTK
jgi:Tol biopolymer transport system component